ncbi:MAG: hypothetical protein QOF76_2274 [Solirubrobacteraceae bacterium]|jgi:hypothetical protein|nr:hypothetical protein [Solirubrobacteraceae bacterium]
MTDLFQDVSRNERAVGIGWRVRVGVMTLMTALAVAGLLNAFGQRTNVTGATSARGSLTVTAPTRVRGGLFFQTRITVLAHAAIAKPELVLDRGVVEGMQVSSIEPAAASESSRDGRLVLSYDRLAPGDRLVVWMQFQVDPTITGSRPYDIALADDSIPIARVNRDIRVLP